MAVDQILADVKQECARQVEKWGEQHHPDGTLKYGIEPEVRDLLREHTDEADKDGTLTWRDILNEEIAESYAEADLDKLRTELVQSAAVIVSWIRDIDSRG